MGTFNACKGTANIFSGYFSGHSIKYFGAPTHTLLTNALSMVSFVGYGLADTTSKAYLSLAVNAPGRSRMDALAPETAKLAKEAGMGAGEYSAASANLNALVNIVLPVLISKLLVQHITTTHSFHIDYFAESCYTCFFFSNLTLQLKLFDRYEWGSQRNMRGMPYWFVATMLALAQVRLMAQR
jgi:hypothetical protein